MSDDQQAPNKKVTLLPLEYFQRAWSEATITQYFEAKWVLWSNDKSVLFPYDNVTVSTDYLESQPITSIYGAPVEVNPALPERTCELWQGNEMLATFTLPEHVITPIVPERKPRDLSITRKR